MRWDLWGSVYTKRQRQCCDNCDTVLMEINGVISDWGWNRALTDVVFFSFGSTQGKNQLWTCSDTWVLSVQDIFKEKKNEVGKNSVGYFGHVLLFERFIKIFLRGPFFKKRMRRRPKWSGKMEPITGFQSIRRFFSESLTNSNYISVKNVFWCFKCSHDWVQKVLNHGRVHICRHEQAIRNTKR